MINSETYFPMFPHILSLLYSLNFTAEQFAEEKSKGKYWLNCYYNAGLQHLKVKWMEGALIEGLQNYKGEAWKETY